jgi:hypothetical protein
MTTSIRSMAVPEDEMRDDEWLDRKCAVCGARYGRHSAAKGQCPKIKQVIVEAAWEETVFKSTIPSED